MPFWLLRSCVARVIASVPAYSAFEPVEIPLETWRGEWLKRLADDGLLVGLNWSGRRAAGYDLTASDVERNLSARRRLTDPET